MPQQGSIFDQDVSCDCGWRGLGNELCLKMCSSEHGAELTGPFCPQCGRDDKLYVWEPEENHR